MSVKICHIITGLGSGGAEKTLFKLVSKMDSKYENTIISLSDFGFYGDKLTKQGIRVYALNISKNNLISKFVKLISIIKKEDPKIIQTWMYHADFIGIFIKLLMPKRKLIWNIRHSTLIKGVDKSTTILIARICGLLSNIPNAIICGSKAAAKSHLKIGYSPKKIKVIQNGFELDNHLSQTTKEQLKEKYGVNGQFIFGHVGRFHPIKNQEVLIRAFGEFQKSNDTSLVLVGNGLEESNEKIKSLLEELKIRNVYLLGHQSNIPEIMRILDVFILPSKSEGFANVLGEAMTMEVPCIATNVGDNKEIIGRTGIVIPTFENIIPDLVSAMLTLYNLSSAERKELGFKAHNRIKENYSTEKIINEYQILYAKEGN
ncbi:Glycosyltransferase involved in cell wall bisynthesis [Bhargavaea ginsengi]|uniref:Glycosyltransferase involved in cell wall bisynthesis n=1 Tax=Bhargavaea ginsengi TaxID=426757 RepID=A0A1H6URP4_9BACL|nr:glycosyltransferase [Bhargavaea ginsengi]SEI92397.1 Glycosyltransferase involved in cell wall bisynthesis [Bhargavaea ginsengi]